MAETVKIAGEDAVPSRRQGNVHACGGRNPVKLRNQYIPLLLSSLGMGTAGQKRSVNFEIRESDGNFMKIFGLVLSIVALAAGSPTFNYGDELYHLPISILKSNYLALATIESKVDSTGPIDGTPYQFKNTNIRFRPVSVFLDERPDAGVQRFVVGTKGFQEKLRVDSTYLLMLSCDSSWCSIEDWKYTRGREILLEKAVIQIGLLLDRSCRKEPYSHVRSRTPAKYLELMPVSQVAFSENVAFIRKHYYWAKVWHPVPDASGFYALRRNSEREKQGFSNPPLYYIAEEIVKVFDQEILDFEKRMELTPGTLLERSWKPN